MYWHKSNWDRNGGVGFCQVKLHPAGAMSLPIWQVQFEFRDNLFYRKSIPGHWAIWSTKFLSHLNDNGEILSELLPSPCLSAEATVQCRYNVVNFLQAPHNSHPIAHRRVLWVHALISVLAQPLEWYIQYHVMLDCVITALDCRIVAFPHGEMWTGFSRRGTVMWQYLCIYLVAYVRGSQFGFCIAIFIFSVSSLGLVVHFVAFVNSFDDIRIACSY